MSHQKMKVMYNLGEASHVLVLLTGVSLIVVLKKNR